MKIPRNIALVVNPLHTKAVTVAGRIEQILKEKAIEHFVFTNFWPVDWTDITEAWIVGGDGTLNYFINQYPQIKLPLAIFKGGTGNDFHWQLYGDLSVEQQVEKVLVSEAKPVDAGYCNNQLFINGVGIGFDGKIVQDLLGTSKWNDQLSYWKIVLRNIFFFRDFLCTVNTENFHWGKKCLMLTVANGQRYGGDFRVNPKGLINDRLLDVYIIGRIFPLLRVFLLPRIQKGTHANLPMITYLKTGNLHIKTPNMVPAHADGEYFEATEFVIECLPARFRFLY